MRHLIHRINNTNWLILSFVIVLAFGACDFDTPIRDADYPDQVIYLPAAVGGWFEIDDISRRIGDTPVPGSTFRYVIDLENRDFIVPLGVYRAGIDNVGEFTVDIAVDNDTINEIIALGDTVITLLASEKYTLDNSVNMPDGEELAKFELRVDLDFLLNNYPDKVYALAVSISSPDREVNSEIGTAIIAIHTNILIPTAGFTFSPDGEDPKTINFLNTSEMAESYSWDFGDGSTSEDEEPSHTYSASGTYSVTLTAIGITGEEDKSVFSTEVIIP